MTINNEIGRRLNEIVEELEHWYNSQENFSPTPFQFPASSACTSTNLRSIEEKQFIFEIKENNLLQNLEPGLSRTRLDLQHCNNIITSSDVFPPKTLYKDNTNFKSNFIRNQVKYKDDENGISLVKKKAYNFLQKLSDSSLMSKLSNSQSINKEFSQIAYKLTDKNNSVDWLAHKLTDINEQSTDWFATIDITVDQFGHYDKNSLKAKIEKCTAEYIKVRIPSDTDVNLSDCGTLKSPTITEYFV